MIGGEYPCQAFDSADFGSPYGAIVGLDIPLSEAVGATAEFSSRRDDDPSGASTGLLAGLSAGWMLVRHSD